MPIDINEAIEFVQDVAGDHQVRETVKGSLTGALAVAAAAGAGALLLGPIGLAIGGTFGGIGTAVALRDKFLPLPVVLINMPPQQKQLLAERVERIMQNVNATDIATLGIMMTSNTALRERVLIELVQFLTQEMQYAIA